MAEKDAMAMNSEMIADAIIVSVNVKPRIRAVLLFMASKILAPRGVVQRLIGFRFSG
jgi:hypothetical protein